MFSVVSAASRNVGIQQKHVLSFQATWLLALCAYVVSRKLHTGGMLEENSYVWSPN